jgi:hypothetical protein
MSEDAPIEPDEDGQPFRAKVIDLDGVRVQWGRPRYKGNRCQHRSLVYSQDERRVWCRDCAQTIEGFSAFMTLVRHFEKMTDEANRKLAKAAEALKAVLIRRVSKDLDRTWGAKMAPCCPHCRKALLPEDFDGRSSSVNADWERSLRAHKAKRPDPSPPPARGRDDADGGGTR